MRYFLELAYKGTDFHGWQEQPNAVSVQNTIENALSLLLKKPTKITGAGRTDAGVHAKQMFAHFDSEPIVDLMELKRRLNSFLNADIVIHNIYNVTHQAHARFDAISRSYEYHIHKEKNPFLQDLSWYFSLPLDMEAMNKAAQSLLSFKDFKSFSKSKTDVKTYICKIEKAYWKKTDKQLIFHITADRFLRNMVRAIVGTLIDLGLGKINYEKFIEIIESKDRTKAGFSVPAEGLYLTRIIYPQKIFINGNT